jgi:chromosome segregation ATPase
MSPLNIKEVNKKIEDICYKLEADRLYYQSLNNAVDRIEKKFEDLKKNSDKQFDAQSDIMVTISELKLFIKSLSERIDTIREQKKTQLEKLIYPIALAIIVFILTQSGNIIYKFIIKGGP